MRNACAFFCIRPVALQMGDGVADQRRDPVNDDGDDGITVTAFGNGVGRTFLFSAAIPRFKDLKQPDQLADMLKYIPFPVDGVGTAQKRDEINGVFLSTPKQFEQHGNLREYTGT